MPSQDNLYARVSDFDAMEAELKATRHHLHANPELSFEEAETARYVADKLEAWGYAVTRNVGGHGVVATLKNGTGTKSIGIRADMDALPIEEETGVAYASTVPGKMHACGHDGHTTVLLGAAEYLARTKTLQRHSDADLPASRRGRAEQRRAADDRRRPVRALSRSTPSSACTTIPACRPARCSRDPVR